MTFEIPRRLDNGDITQGPSRETEIRSRIGGGRTLLDRVTDRLFDLIRNQSDLCGSGVPLHRHKVKMIAREILAEVERP